MDSNTKMFKLNKNSETLFFRLFKCIVLVISFTPLREVWKSQSEHRVEIDDFQLWAGSEGMTFTTFLEVRSNWVGGRGQSIHTSEVISLKMK